jgi:hypothetical protein
MRPRRQFAAGWQRGARWVRLRGAHLAAAFLFLLLGSTATVTFLADFEAGYFVARTPSSGPLGLSSWTLLATANTAAALLALLTVSALGSAVLAWVAGLGRATLLSQVFEFTSSLPAVLLGLFWCAATERASCLELAVIVGLQRAFQLAPVVNQARLQPMPATGRTLYPIGNSASALLRRWWSVTGVGAAQSVGLFASLEVSTILLGFTPSSPRTWPSTVAAAVTRPDEVSTSMVVVSAVGMLAVPLALWILADGAVKRALTLTEQPPPSGDQPSSATSPS